jgi:hypothetical protein
MIGGDREQIWFNFGANLQLVIDACLAAGRKAAANG